MHHICSILSNLKYLTLSGHELSPIKHLTLNIPHQEKFRWKEKSILKDVVMHVSSCTLPTHYCYYVVSRIHNMFYLEIGVF